MKRLAFLLIAAPLILASTAAFSWNCGTQSTTAPIGIYINGTPSPTPTPTPTTYPNGAPCSLNEQCQSLKCVDGACKK